MRAFRAPGSTFKTSGLARSFVQAPIRSSNLIYGASKRNFCTLTHIEKNETYLVITASGPDKVGMTANLVNKIVDHKGSVEESRMTRLGDAFSSKQQMIKSILMNSVMMLLRVPSAEEKNLRTALEKVPDLKVAVDKTALTHVPRPQWKRRIIKLTGADNTGLVAGVANYCKTNGINIDNLESHLVRASFSGYPLFNLEAAVSIPPSIKPAKVEQDIEELGDKLGVDMWVDLWTDPHDVN